MSPPPAGTAGDPGPDGGIRWDGVAALAVGLAVNELTLEATVVPDGEIGSTLLRLVVAGFQLLAVGTGLFVLLRRPAVRLPWKRGGLAALGAGLAWFGCFAVLDLYGPGLAAGVGGLDYFAYRARFETDSTLVMVPRETGHTVRSELDGDLTAPGDGLPELDIPYRASYNQWGFRRNLGSPPYEIVVIGDSFVAFGESDSTTVSEMLRRETSLSTFNLGRGWYGPHQYVELLRRHGLALEPRFALLCFFEGNDVRDAASYLGWRQGGSYQDFSLIEGNLLERFRNMNYELATEIQRTVGELLDDDGEPKGRQGYSGRQTLPLMLEGRRTPMRFAYWPDPTASAEELLGRSAWREIRAQLTRFRDLTTAADIVPVVVAIPTKFSVYAPFLAETPGRSTTFGGRPGEQGAGVSSVRVRALERLGRELDLAVVDLTPAFRRRAARGALLYYRQDSHWSPEGRRTAADTLADFLAERWPDTVDRPFSPGGGGPR